MEKVKNKIKDVLDFLVLIFIYILVPQVIGIIIFKVFKLPESTSVYLGNFFVLIIYFMMYKDKLLKNLKDYFSKVSNFSDSLKYWGMGFGIMILSNIIINVFILNNAGSTNENLVRDSLKIYPVIGFLSISVVAPFVEEMIFRFGLRKVTGKNKFFPLVSALVFGFLHTIAGLQDGNFLELLYIIPYGALGYTFGLVYNKSNNIFSSVVAHMMHNTLVYGLIMMAQ